MNKIYQIKYSLFDKNNNVIKWGEIKWGEIKVKNKDNELAAKVSLEKFLSRKYVFERMIIHECNRNYYEEMKNGGNPIEDIFKGGFR